MSIHTVWTICITNFSLVASSMTPCYGNAQLSIVASLVDHQFPHHQNVRMEGSLAGLTLPVKYTCSCVGKNTVN